jgi:SOS-response transcriptional repressor LexA
LVYRQAQKHQIGLLICHRNGETIDFMSGKYPNRLAEALEKSGMSAAELARKAETAPQNVYRFAKEERELTKPWAELFAPWLGFRPADLIFGDGGGEIRRVPLISPIAAGKWMEMPSMMASDEPHRWASERLPHGDWIAFEVLGDSMNVVAPDGSIVFANRQERELVSGGLFAICQSDGDATFKRYRSSPHRLEPMSTNPAHETIYFDDTGKIDVIGRVKKVVNDLP